MVLLDVVTGFGEPCLNEILSHVGHLWTEHVVLLDVVTGFGGQRMVKVNHVGTMCRPLVTVLIAVHVQRNVTQSSVKHLPDMYTVLK